MTTSNFVDEMKKTNPYLAVSNSEFIGDLSENSFSGNSRGNKIIALVAMNG